MVDERDVGLKVLQVELVEDSYKTHRLKNGLDPMRFPVVVWFTRRLNTYERIELAKRGWEVHYGGADEHDSMRALIETTADHFEQTIAQLNDDLSVVETDARQAKVNAEAEDEHIAKLVQKINLNLMPEKWSDD